MRRVQPVLSRRLFAVLNEASRDTRSDGYAAGCDKYKHVAILEEHSSIGGLTSAISEHYMENNYTNKFLKLNTGEQFILKSGNQKKAHENLNISPKSIEKKILHFLKT